MTTVKNITRLNEVESIYAEIARLVGLGELDKALALRVNADKLRVNWKK